MVYIRTCISYHSRVAIVSVRVHVLRCCSQITCRCSPGCLVHDTLQVLALLKEQSCEQRRAGIECSWRQYLQVSGICAAARVLSGLFELGWCRHTVCDCSILHTECSCVNIKHSMHQCEQPHSMQQQQLSYTACKQCEQPPSRHQLQPITLAAANHTCCSQSHLLHCRR